MAINSKQKGKRGELMLVSKLKEHGFSKVRRSVQYSGKVETAADLIGLDGIHIECKNSEVLKVFDYLAQAKADAKNGNLPTVFYKKNNCKWLVIQELDDWMKLYKGEHMNENN